MQLRDPMILLLIAAGAVTAGLGDAPDTAIIALVVAVNTTIGVVQERRAELAISALRQLTPATATVVRDGSEQPVASADVVPGDLAVLTSGDVVPADCVVLEAHMLRLDEAATTGESFPVERGIDDEVAAGTIVVRGRAVARVLRTGPDSGLGRIAAMVATAPPRPTPLQLRLSRLSGQLVAAVAVLVVIVLLIGVAQGRPILDMVVIAVSLAVAAVPESLPAVVSVALALGAHRMARRHAIVRRLPAVETLGSVTVLASDKTGTLTEGTMFAERLWTPGGWYTATGRGYHLAGDLRPDTPTADDPAYLRRALRDLLLCNDATLRPRDGGWEAAGDPIDAALLALAGKGARDVASLRGAWARVAEHPFDETVRTMTTLHGTADDAWLVTCKGAPEAVFARVSATPALDDAAGAVEELTGQGYRVLAVADKESSAPPALSDADLQLVALVAVNDPPRETAKEVVENCQRAGIRVLIVTGDHPDTARAVADRLGILRSSPEVARVDDLPPRAWGGESIGVFARTRPEQKVDIVEALQARGETVAVTGDGVNDAPALKRADIGVAMGGSGTEVARQASALVLADDDLRTVVAAVEEGRRVYANIRTFLRYGISGGFAEILVMLLGPFLGLGVPLLPGQILWINLVTHGLPGVAFGAEPADPARMARPSRSPRESILGHGLAYQIVVTGIVIAAVTLGAAHLLADGVAETRTTVFLTLGLAQLGVALALRVPVRRGGLRDQSLLVAILCAGALQVAAAYLPGLNDAVRTSPLDTGMLLPLVMLAALPGCLVRVTQWWRRLRTTE